MAGIRFSVVITCYNQRDFIQSAVHSALAQNHPQKEVIVVDDGSTDGSVEALQQYVGSINLLTFPCNRGAIEARNHGAALAKGEYFVFLDGDDLFAPWALDVYEEIVAHRHPRIIFGKSFWFKGAIPALNDRDIPARVEYVEYENLIAKDRPIGMSASTLVIDRQSFQNVGGWTPAIFHLDCVDLASKTRYSGRTVLLCAPFTVFYRIHSANSILTVPPFLQMAHRLILKEESGEYPRQGKDRFERYGWLGGVIAFWVKKALRAGLYRKGLRLGVTAWAMILCAVVCRCAAWIDGLCPVEIIDLVLK